MVERWHDKTLFAEAYWHQQLASERAERARELLRSDLVEGFEVLVAIVHILDDDADLELASSAVRGFWYTHRDAALERLEPLAADSLRWYAIMGSLAEFWAAKDASLAAAMERLLAKWHGLPPSSPKRISSDVESTGERFEERLESSTEREGLAAAWCMSEITFWTSGLLEQLDPVTAWSYMVAVARSRLGDDDLRTFGAGSPENLLGDHGDALIDRIESDARSDARVRLMLSGAWQTTEMDDALWARVENALGEYRDGRRENAGQSPLLQHMREQRIWPGVRYPGGRERLEALLGEVKQTYTIDEVAKIVGRTSQQVHDEIDTGALIEVGPPFARSVPLISLIACYFPDLLNAQDGSS
jgi:hypothetical protein